MSINVVSVTYIHALSVSNVVPDSDGRTVRPSVRLANTRCDRCSAVAGRIMCAPAVVLKNGLFPAVGEGSSTHNYTRNSWVIPQLPPFSKWLQHALIIDTDNLEDTIAYNDPMQDAAIYCLISRTADDNNTMHDTTK